MGMYLLAAIVFLLFVVFISDLLKDSKSKQQNIQRNLYQTEFGEDDFFIEDDLDELESDDDRQDENDTHKMDYINRYYAEEYSDDENFRMKFREYDEEFGQEETPITGNDYTSELYNGDVTRVFDHDVIEEKEEEYKR